MIILRAPANGPETMTVLPDPEFDDSYKFDVEAKLRKSMNDTPYTYVRSAGVRQLVFTILMDRSKSLEFIAFVEKYFDTKIQLTTHLDEIFHGYITSEPPTLQSTGRVNAQSVDIEFEGVQVA